MPPETVCTRVNDKIIHHLVFKFIFLSYEQVQAEVTNLKLIMKRQSFKIVQEDFRNRAKSQK